MSGSFAQSEREREVGLDGLSDFRAASPADIQVSQRCQRHAGLLLSVPPRHPPPQATPLEGTVSLVETSMQLSSNNGSSASSV
jgi:hypothetical protein